MRQDSQQLSHHLSSGILVASFVIFAGLSIAWMEMQSVPTLGANLNNSQSLSSVGELYPVSPEEFPDSDKELELQIFDCQGNGCNNTTVKRDDALDTDEDKGVIDTLDLVTRMLSTESKDLIVADLNSDGVINSFDLSLLERAEIGKSN